MLASFLRLRKPQDFQVVKREGKRWNGKLLTLNIKPNDLPNSRFGFIVNKRIGKAVVRNRIKRRLRTIVCQQSLLFSLSYDVVIVAHPTSTFATYAELKEEACRLFRLARLLT